MTRAERRARTERIVERRVRDWNSRYDPISAARRGRSRKLHPFDCGQPACPTCHTLKLFKRPRVRDLKALASAREEMEHPECDRERIRCEIADIEEPVWLLGDYDNEPRLLAEAFRTTFPL